MKFAISAGHDITADAAVQVLLEGGNAIDAAIAALFAAFVAEPCMASGGGGGFANVFTAEREAFIFDFFCQTPKRKRELEKIEFFPVHLNFGSDTETYYIGKGSSGTPGSIAGIYALHDAMGTMPMTELVHPAIRAAKEGVVINDFQHLDMSLLQEILGQGEEGRRLFFQDNQLRPVGEKMVMPEFADFLEYLAMEGKDAFYRGEIAGKIAGDYKQGGGYLTLEDLESYEVIRRKLLRFSFRDKEVITNPLPAAGGALLLLSLKEIASERKLKQDFQQHLQNGHLKCWHKVLARIDQMPKALDHLRALVGGEASAGSNASKRGSTTHFNIVDRWNNAVSLTTTVGEGSGYFVPGTNIQMNNMLGEKALVPEGFNQWKTDVRLSTMMSPTIVLDGKGDPQIVLGSGGASRIPFAIAQVLYNMLHYQMEAHEAVNAPRLHLQDNLFHIEEGFWEEELRRFLRSEPEQQVRTWSEKSLFFGGVHTLQHHKGSWIAAADERRDGVVRVRGG